MEQKIKVHVDVNERNFGVAVRDFLLLAAVLYAVVSGLAWAWEAESQWERDHREIPEALREVYQ